MVDDVSMTVASGSITVLVGTSGSGKSTVLRMINRLIAPTSGRVLIDGRDTMAVPEHELRRRIGYAIQGHGLFPHRTVAQNIATVPQLLQWPKARVDARVEELLGVFQLTAGRVRRANTRTSCRAASSSGSAWLGPWPRSPSCCSWTSRSVPSTPSFAARRRTISWPSSASSAPRSYW